MYALLRHGGGLRFCDAKRNIFSMKMFTAAERRRRPPPQAKAAFKRRAKNPQKRP